MPAGEQKRSQTAAAHEASIKALVQRDREAMLNMALGGATPPEMLVILSQAQESNIRAAVAGNPATPSAVGVSLARDEDPLVRAGIAARLATMLPDVRSGERRKLAARAAGILNALANDASIAVRRILSEEICRLEEVPKDVALKLARDIDDLVAIPVCQFSPVLDDKDLIDLIAIRGGPVALAAIARRDNLGADVSETLVATGDTAAIGALLENKSAQIRENTLDNIVARAENEVSWHAALCDRPEITSALAMKLAAFVAARFIEQLAARQDFDTATLSLLTQKVAESLNSSGPRTLVENGSVAVPGEDEIVQAIKMRQEAKLIWLVAAKAGVGNSVIRRIYSTRMPKVIVALAWKTGLSMKTAELLQRYPGFVPEARVIVCGEDGLFPMSEKDMEWQLSSFGM